MAKFKYGQNLVEALDEFTDLGLKVKADGSRATWTDVGTGAKIIVDGKNLAASGDNEDLLGSGRITHAEILDGDRKLVVDISGIDFKATRIMHAFEQGGVETLAYFVLTTADDIVIGSRHGDILVGGGGDDVMTGKGGSDEFDFQMPIEQRGAKAGVEHDIITDFDTKGEDADVLGTRETFEHRGVHKGQDTLLTFETGSTLLLEGVKKSEFQDYLESQVF